MPDFREKFENIKAKTPVKMPRLPKFETPIGMPAMPAFPAMPTMNIPTPKMPKMPDFPSLKLPSPGMPKLPAMPQMPQIAMPSVRMPTITTPGMPSMPSMPKLGDMRTPMKMPALGSLNPLNFDLASSIQTVKGRMPGMPLTLKDISTPMRAAMMPKLVVPKVPTLSESDQQIVDAIKWSVQTVSNGIQIFVFITYTSLIDGAKKYVLTKDGLIVVLYFWAEILLRNAIYTQETHNWMTKGNPLSSAAKSQVGVPIAAAVIDGDEVSPLSMFAIFNSRHFSMIVLILLNRLNR